MSTVQKALVTAIIAITAGAAIFQTYEASRLRKEVQSSQKQHTEQIQQLQTERDQAVEQLAGQRQEVERLGRNADELLRLRGEVTRLRQQANEVTALRTENNQLRNRAATRQAEPPPASPAASPAPIPVAAEETVKQRNQCINNLKQIGAAIEQCALANKLTITSVVTANHLLPYLPGNKLPVCPAGGNYTFSSLTNNPTCSIPAHNVQW